MTRLIFRGFRALWDREKLFLPVKVINWSAVIVSEHSRESSIHVIEPGFKSEKK